MKLRVIETMVIFYPSLIIFLLSAIQTGHGFDCPFADQNPVTGKSYKTLGLATPQYGRTLCENEGGQLLMIKDDRDFDFIKTYYPVTGKTAQSWLKS